MLEFLSNLTIGEIAGTITTLISLGIAVWEALKLRDYSGALEKAKGLVDNFLFLVDRLKGITPSTQRQPVLKEFGKVLEESGDKKTVDERLAQLGLDNKS